MTTAIYDRSVRAEATVPAEIHLSLCVRDAEIIGELCQRDNGEPRENYAVAALRLGILALRLSGQCH